MNSRIDDLAPQRRAEEARWEAKRAALVAAVRRTEEGAAILRARLQAHWWAKLDASRQGMMTAAEAGPVGAAGRDDAQAVE